MTTFLRSSSLTSFADVALPSIVGLILKQVGLPLLSTRLLILTDILTIPRIVEIIIGVYNIALHFVAFLDEVFPIMYHNTSLATVFPFIFVETFLRHDLSELAMFFGFGFCVNLRLGNYSSGLWAS